MRRGPTRSEVADLGWEPPPGAAPILAFAAGDEMYDTTPTDDDPLPRLDEDGLLRVGGDWVAVPDAQLPVVALLVDRFGTLVHRDAIVAAYVAAGHSGHEASIRSLLARISHRVEGLGLQLDTVRGRGVMLRRRGATR